MVNGKTVDLGEKSVSKGSAIDLSWTISKVTGDVSSITVTEKNAPKTYTVKALAVDGAATAVADGTNYYYLYNGLKIRVIGSGTRTAQEGGAVTLQFTVEGANTTGSPVVMQVNSGLNGSFNTAMSTGVDSLGSVDFNVGANQPIVGTITVTVQLSNIMSDCTPTITFA